MIVFSDTFALDVKSIDDFDIELNLIDGTRMEELRCKEASCCFELIDVAWSCIKNRNLHSLSPQLIP